MGGLQETSHRRHLQDIPFASQSHSFTPVLLPGLDNVVLLLLFSLFV